MQGLNDKVRRLAELIKGSKRTVVFTGAGISTASGIPDFRGKDGLWKKIDPMDVFSYSAFKRDPARFYRFYKERLLILFDAQPNDAHIALAEMEKAGLVYGVITQNIDGLHQKAGSEKVVEIHGSIRRAVCERCGRVVGIHEFWDMLQKSDIPYCNCGGIFKIDVVLFEEALPSDAWLEAVSMASSCELMLVIGSSLQVMPAAEIPYVAYTKGAKVAIVNASPTYVDDVATILINEDIPVVMNRVLEILKGGEKVGQ